MNRQDWMGFPMTAVAVAVAVVAAAPALAQNTTSAVGGTVVGLDGKPIAGAAVTVVHTESRSTASTVTDAGGRWVARGLRVGGPYTITVSKAGDTEKREGIYLALAETLSLDLLLGRSAQVTVTGSRILSDRFSSSNMGSTTAIGARDLANLSSLTGNLQDFARIDPRISQTDKERGEISALGQNSRFNAVTIDGVNISDTFGLESNNLPTAKQPISSWAIQSVQVNLSNYDVTQRGYTGANINAVTKSGTNEFHGAVYGSYRDENMTGKRFNRTNRTYSEAPAFTAEQKGFVLGGPVIQDKLFFFVGYEESKSSISSIDFGPIGSAKTNVGISTALITSLTDIARNTYNFDLGSTEPPGESFLIVKDALVKLDWSISDAQRATLRFTRTKQDEPIFPNIGTRTLSLSTNWYTQQKSLDTVVAQVFSDWSPSFSTEVRASFRDYKSEPKNNATLPEIRFDVDGSFGSPTPSTAQRTLFTGTERSRQFNKLFTKTVDGFLGGNWNVGDHEMKFGAELSQNKIYNAFLQDANGQYKFQCESSYSYNTVTFSGGTNTVPASCLTATQAERDAAIVENFQRGRASAYQAQLALPGKTLDDGVAKWNLNNYGLFLQDTWTLAPKVTISAGARVDLISMPDKPVANAAAAAPVVAGVVTGRGTGTRQTGGFGYDNTVTPDGDTLLQPRIGFNWDLGGKDKKLQLRGGLGLFQGAAANVWISNPFSNTGTATSFYGCGPGGELSGGTTRAACSTTASSFNPDPNAQARIGANPAASVDFLDPGLTQPSVWKTNLAIDVEGPVGLIFGAEWVHTKVNKGVYYRHLNLGTPTAYGSDGRELYYNAAGLSENCWNTTGGTLASGCGGASAPGAVTSRALSNNSFANVLLATGTNKGNGDAITLGVAQQPYPGVTWQLAYTRTRATEVSPLTSSVANSNWAARSIFNPNEDVAARSAYEIRDRVSGTLNFEKALFGKLKSTFGVTYEGRRGKTYSWTYFNDLNGDGQAGNDLMYIPSAFGSGEVKFASVAEEQRFWDIVNQFPELRTSAGKVVGRNSGTAPWVSNFDVRLTQEVPGFLSTHKAKIKFDIFNFGNLLNRKWGRIDEVAFQSAGGNARSFVNYKGTDATTGKYVYSVSSLEDYTTRQAKNESQWAAQISLSYEF